MIIEVTQEDIDHGEKKKCMECPVARAINRAHKGARAAVGDYCIGIKTGFLKTETVPTPPEVQAFVLAFDAGRPVSPFTFSLPLEELVGGGA